MCGMLVGGNLAERAGRRAPLLAGNALLFGGWVVVYLARDFAAVMTGRVLSGLGIGMVMTVTYLGRGQFQWA